MDAATAPGAIIVDVSRNVMRSWCAYQTSAPLISMNVFKSKDHREAPPQRRSKGLVSAFIHGLLGETRVFARPRIEPELLRRLIRNVSHCSAVASARHPDRCAALAARPHRRREW
jgi:hypothetical protein